MSAYSEIHDRVLALGTVRDGYERVVFLGVSARRSLTAVQALGDIAPGFWYTDGTNERLLGLLVRDTSEFDGWAIREIGPAGRWEDAA